MSDPNTLELLGNIVDSAAADNSIEVAKSFDDVMNARLDAHIDQMKADMAKGMFAGPFEVNEPEEGEEIEDDEEDEPEEDEPESEEDDGEVELDMSDDEIDDLLDTINSQEEEEPDGEETT